MESTSQVTSIELTRQERLTLQMKRSGLTFRGLGTMAGITGACAARHLKSESIPPYHHEVWVTVLSADLLPPPVAPRFGPKPKTDGEGQDETKAAA